MGRLIEIMRACQGTLTQGEFAQLLGVSQSAISMIYSGQRRPGHGLIARLGAQYPEHKEELASALFFAPEYHYCDIAITGDDEAASDSDSE